MIAVNAGNPFSHVDRVIASDRRIGMSHSLIKEITYGPAYKNAVMCLKRQGVRLPTFAQLADPHQVSKRITDELTAVDPDTPHAGNLFRVHWYNDSQRRTLCEVPIYTLIPEELTGVRSPIAVLLGNRFPLVRAHKVLAAYGCIVPPLVAGRFDPQRNRAIWPSTGNYCRGGVAISRILGCRGVAVLPEGMSLERFEWLRKWVTNQEDVIRTPGSESNVREIYEECARLAADEESMVFNQFSEFGNYLVHYFCTGRAVEHVFEDVSSRVGRVRLAGFVAGTGSAGTLGAGDYLKERHGTRIVAVEPVECSTMLYNDYGAHNIQGIGDKHIPFIHNVMNTDVVVAVSDRDSDRLNVLFNTEPGSRYLSTRKRIDAPVLEGLRSLGLSGIANVLAAIKLSRHLDLGSEDLLITVATDGAELYGSEIERVCDRYFPEGFTEFDAAETFGCSLMGLRDDHVLELAHQHRRRIFNLGYYTWVEQQGVSQTEFDRRGDDRFWHDLKEFIPIWDNMIDEFNGRTGLALSD